MRIGIATDHNGVNEKKELITFLQDLNYQVFDFSPNNTPTDDYPDYAFLVADALNSQKIDRGILLCGTGIGMSIAANKIKGIRCAKVSNAQEAFLARNHNDANIIALSYTMERSELEAAIVKFLQTEFSGDERHLRRINKITERENHR